MKKFAVFLGIFLIFGMVSQASALSFGDEFFVGTITPGGGNPWEEAAQVNNLIVLEPSTNDTIDGNFYLRSTNIFDPPLSPIDLITVDDGDKQDNGNTTFDATGYQYVIGKYANGQAGVAVWYDASGFDGLVSLPGTWTDNQYGLSHSVGFNPAPVPEPSTILLLGLGLVGLAGLGRKRIKS